MTPMGNWAGRIVVLSVLVVLVVGCDGKGPTDSGPRSGITFERGASATDTAMGQPTQALVVRVRDEAGKPRSGLAIRFESVMHSSSSPYFQDLEAYVGRLESEYMGSLVMDTTDSQGRAQVRVQMGRVVGPARIVVTVPTLGLQDTASYTVTPASASRVSLEPRDTVLYPGKTFSLRGGVVDQWGNRREDAVTFTGSQGVVVDAKGVVSTTATGRSFVVAQAQGKVDTVWVSVPPGGTLAASARGGLGIMTVNLDGTDLRLLFSTPHHNDFIAPTWMPSGKEIIFQDGPYWDKRLYRVDLSGTVRRFLDPSPPLLLSEEWPQFSPDGRSVYFLGRAAEAVNLWRAAPDGTGATPVGSSGDELNDAWHPSPSPDGRRLVFILGYGEPRVRILDLSTGSVIPLDIPGNTPRWSPKEDVIAYRKPDGSIGLVKPDGTGQRTVSRPGAYYDYGFNWSPDGEWLAARNIGFGHLDLIHVESGVVIPLLFTDNLANPAWKP